MTKFRYSTHARTRMQQRSIFRTEVETLIEEADHHVPVGRGLLALSIRRRSASDVRDRRGQTAVTERLLRTCVVIDPASALVVTALHRYGRRGGRYLRRNARGRS